MNTVTAIILLLVGAAVFLTGMRLMSSGLQKATGKGVKTLFRKIQNNRFAGIGIGAVVTALIQSSAATAIMAIGFINAGVMSVFQGLSVIMGAFLGTTVTGLLVSLSSFNISIYFMLFAFVGVVMTFINKKIVKYIGEILTGLGLLFFGLEALKQGFGHSDITAFFSNMFTAIDFPPLLLLIGIVITALVQSSSATTGIVIVMVGSGAIGFEKGLYLAIGATIGTVVPILIATAGGSANGKRAAVLAFITRILMGIAGLIIVWIFATPISDALEAAFQNPQLALAMFTIIYNVIYLIIFLPFLHPLVKFGERLVKDKSQEKLRASLKFIDKRMVNNPAIALMQVKKEIEHMADLARINLDLGYQMMMTLDLSKEQELNQREDSIDYINNAITDFLINVSTHADHDEEKIIGGYFHVINDIERIGDHGANFKDMALRMKEDDLDFSEIAHEEFKRMYGVVEGMFAMAMLVFDDHSKVDLHKLDSLENRVDELKDELNSAHYARLKNQSCRVELSPFYTSLVSELERVADHLINVGHSFINPTGDDEIVGYSAQKPFN